MSSGYPDNPPDGQRPLDAQAMAQARASALVPGVLLIVTGVLSMIGTSLALIQLPEVPARMDEAIAKIDADPKVPQDQKDTVREILTSVKEVAQHPAAPAGYIAGLVASLVVVVGGVKLMNLSGTALPVAGSVLAMIPCTVGCCCLLGLPAGIWGLVVLSRPDVRAAIAARRTAPPPDPDAQYMR